MEKIILISSFMATGAAWGMAWSGCFGVLKKDMCSASLLKLVSLIFVVAGSIYAGYIIYSLYQEYSAGTDSQQASIKGLFSGEGLFTNGGKLLIQVSPLALILPPFRKSKVICAVVGTCYVLLPFYGLIISKVTQ